MEANVDPRVKPEDDGAWGDLWSKGSEEYEHSCNFYVGLAPPHPPAGTFPRGEKRICRDLSAPRAPFVRYV